MIKADGELSGLGSENCYIQRFPVSDEQIAVDAGASGFSGRCAKKRR
jgi:hypothetical protein